MITDFRTLDSGQGRRHSGPSRSHEPLAQREQHSPVSDVMRRDFVVADASDMLDLVLQRLQGHDCHTIPVMRRGGLIGLLTMDNVGEFLSIQAAPDVRTIHGCRAGRRGQRRGPTPSRPSLVPIVHEAQARVES